jgi:hypothetical protein
MDMGRPSANIKATEVKIPITVRFPLWYRNKLRKIAAEEEVTLTELIITATQDKYPAVK